MRIWRKVEFLSVFLCSTWYIRGSNVLICTIDQNNNNNSEKMKDLEYKPKMEWDRVYKAKSIVFIKVN